MERKMKEHGMKGERAWNGRRKSMEWKVKEHGMEGERAWQRSVYKGA